MSSNLYWKPPEPAGKTLGDELKFVLRDRFGGSSFYEWQTLGRESIGFLQGLVAASGTGKPLGRDAQFLLDQIEKYGEIDVREHS